MRRYWTPTSNSMLVIYPSEHTRTAHALSKLSPPPFANQVI
jgi:hypothetical protein